jgi:hypothetical protein
VEVTPWNLVQYSEDFSNAVWTTANLSISANTTTAPNGTTTADTITEDTSTTRKILYTTPTIVANQEITLTIYVKKNTLQYVRLIANDLSENFRWFGAQFDLTALTYTSATGSNGNATFTSASITDAGNGWYRIAVSGTINTTSLLFGIFPSDGTALSSSDDRGGNTYLGTGKTAYIWGAQLNIGSTAKPYFPTTDRLNVPRLTYQNGGGGCPSLLLEKQSTNLVSYSQDFSNAYWSKLGQGIAATAVLTANYAISPDGTQNATRFVCNLNGGTSSSDRSWMVASFTAPSTSTISIWIKLNSVGTKTFVFSDSGGDTKTISGTEWQRIDGTFVGAGGEFRIGLIGGTGSSDTLDCCIWGAQAEASSYPTSYIPTTSSSATRVADACSKTGISSLIGQTEGTLFVDLVWNNPIEDVVPLDITGSDGKLIWMRGIGAQFYGNGTTLIVNIGVNGAVQGTRYKIAFLYGANDFKLYRNGALIGTDTSGTFTGSFSDIALNAVINQSNLFNQVVLFKTKLTDAELIALTTI